MRLYHPNSLQINSSLHLPGLLLGDGFLQQLQGSIQKLILSFCLRYISTYQGMPSNRLVASALYMARCWKDSTSCCRVSVIRGSAKGETYSAFLSCGVSAQPMHTLTDSQALRLRPHSDFSTLGKSTDVSCHSSNHSRHFCHDIFCLKRTVRSRRVPGFFHWAEWRLQEVCTKIATGLWRS